MIICPKCSFDNPLGRVFCGKCGGKLDFSHTSQQEMSDQSQPGVARRVVKIVVLVVLLLMVAVAGVALWPKSAPIGKTGEAVGARRAANTVRAIGIVKKGQVLTVPLTEEDLNAYFATDKFKQLGYQSLSVSAGQGFFTIRAVRVLGPWKMGSYVMKPPFSLEISCVPASGKAVVHKAAFGHLPMFGPLKGLVTDAMIGKVADDPAWKPFTTLSDLKAETGRINVTVKP